MSRPDFKPGEVVYLNSGSPALTVISTQTDGSVKVTWMSEATSSHASSGGNDPAVHFHAFPKECLTDKEPKVQRVLQFLSGDSLIMSPQPATPQIVINSDLSAKQVASEVYALLEKSISRMLVTDEFGRLIVSTKSSLSSETSQVGQESKVAEAAPTSDAKTAEKPPTPLLQPVKPRKQ